MKAKEKRKWGDEPLSESDMAVLDFSTDKLDALDTPRPTDANIQSLVDKNSLGTRDKDGLYEIKDWEFSKAGDNDFLSKVLQESQGTAKENTAGSLGALGSIFARLTGTKTLSEGDIKPVLQGMEQHLMKKNVAKEIAEKICEGVGEGLVGKKVGSFQSKS